MDDNNTLIHDRVVDSDRIWACLLANDSYLPGLLTLAFSLRRVRSRYPLVALHTGTGSLAPETFAALRERGIPAQRVPELRPSPPSKLARMTRVASSNGSGPEEARAGADKSVAGADGSQSHQTNGHGKKRGVDHDSERNGNGHDNGHGNVVLTDDDDAYRNDPRFLPAFTKLAAFAMAGYKRVALVDADMLVLRNMDELLDEAWLPLAYAPPLAHDDDSHDSRKATLATNGSNGIMNGAAQSNGNGISGTSNSRNGVSGGQGSGRVLAASHACLCNPRHFPHYPADWVPDNCAFGKQHGNPARAQTDGGATTGGIGEVCLNGGLVVLEPGRGEAYAEIMSFLRSGRATAATLPFADQSLLARVFRGRWVSLPYVYNALKTMRWDGVHAAIWRDDKVKNVHYILTPKPWEVPERGKMEETERWWWGIDAERRRCESERGLSWNDWRGEGTVTVSGV